MQNKKSQMEIMGLAIVIILLILGLLFVARFVINTKPTDYRNNFVPEQLVSNILNAFLNTNAKDCKGMLMKELIRDCAQFETVLCDTKQSCAYVKDSMDYVLNKTLKEWKYKYHFLVYFSDDEDNKKIELGEECFGSRKSERYIVPTSLGGLYTRLDICTK